MNNATKLLSLSDISYHIGQQRILSHIDIDIAVNETVSLIGPNGAGKSTLVKLVLGLIEPTLYGRAHFTVTRVRFIGPSRQKAPNT